MRSRLAHAEAHGATGVGGLGELHRGRQQDRLAERDLDRERVWEARVERGQAAGLRPHAVGDRRGKRSSRAVSGWTWIGLRSPETEP